MKKLFTSTLLTVAAVPFLMAAPAAKKVQNPAASAPAQSTAKPKVSKKHVKKSNAKSASTPAPATPSK